jgi:hypothetical protein
VERIVRDVMALYRDRWRFADETIRAGWEWEDRMRREGWAREDALRPVVPPALSDELVPDDLVAFAMSHPEQFQQDVIAAAREKYAVSGNWNTVRRAFGIGERDA